MDGYRLEEKTNWLLDITGEDENMMKKFIMHLKQVYCKCAKDGAKAALDLFYIMINYSPGIERVYIQILTPR